MQKNNKPYYLEEILPFIRDQYTIEGDKSVSFSDIRSPEEADSKDLAWCSPKKEDREDLIRSTKAAVVICDDKLPEGLAAEKTLIKTEDPRKTFMEIVNGLKAREQTYGVHPTAVIHPEAEIHDQVYIGPFSYVGKSKIDRGTVIHGHVYIYDHVEMGENIVVEAGCIIGADGYGYQKNHDGDWERFPHLGGVIIHDDVEISSNATIDRGSLGNTIVGENTKISKASHLSHNVITGKRCIIAGGAMVSGSVTMGDNVWIGPNATILQKLTINEDVTVSIGAVVTKNIEKGFTAVGNRIIPDKMINK